MGEPHVPGLQRGWEPPTMSLGCVFENGLCARFDERTRVKRLSERDLSMETKISSIFLPGIDLNTMVFDKLGYIANSSDAVLEALDAGFRRLYLNVYYDDVFSKWHLCPYRPETAANTTTTLTPPATTSIYPLSEYPDEPIEYWKRALGVSQCDYELDLAMFVDSVQYYLTLSDTNIAADLLYIHLRPMQWPDNGTIVPYTFGQASLNDSFAPIADRIFAPSRFDGSAKHSSTSKSATKTEIKATTTNPNAIVADDSDSDSETEDEDEEWPTLHQFIYTNTDRVVLSYDPGSLENTSESSKLSSIAFASSATISDPMSYSLSDLSQMNFTDSFVSNSEEWSTAIAAGISPVLNDSSMGFFSDELLTLLETNTDWAWSSTQPSLYSVASRKEALSNSDNETLPACAVFSSSGFIVGNCYAHFRVLCRSNDDRLDWVLSSRDTYFSAQCPSNYKFAVPASPLESRSIREKFFAQNSTLEYAWVNFNSLFYPNCWVSDGPTSVCPYNVVENDRNGVGFIIVSATIAGVIGIITFLFEWDRRRSPLTRNFRRVPVERTVEYEGIPS